MTRTMHLVLFCSMVLAVSSAPTAPKDDEHILGTPRVPSEQTSSSHNDHSTTSRQIETEEVRSGDESSDSSKPLPNDDEGTVADSRESSAVLLKTSLKKKHLPKKFKGTEGLIEDTVPDLRESSTVYLESSPQKKPFQKKVKGTSSPLGYEKARATGLEETGAVHLDSSSYEDTGAVTFTEEDDNPEKVLKTLEHQEKSVDIDESTKKEPSKDLHTFANHKKGNPKQIKSEKLHRTEDFSGSESETSKVTFLKEKPTLSELPKDDPNKEELKEKNKSENVPVNSDGSYKSYRYDPETGDFVEVDESDATQGREKEITHVQYNVDDDSENEREPRTSRKEDLNAVREEIKKIKSQFGGFFPKLFKTPLSDNGDKELVKVQVNKNGVSKNYIYSPGKGKLVKFGQLDKSAKYKGDPKGTIGIEY